MRKIVSLVILLFAAILLFSITFAHSHTFLSSDIEETTSSISSGSHDQFPFDNNDGKVKISSILFLVTLIFIVLRGNFDNHLLYQSIRRPVWMTPIFYQSNYVIKTL
ncbi:hypothetical protein [Ferdinandcohnia sp. Marseille-Q9671]